MNMYKITTNSHGRILEIIATAKTAEDALKDFKQANKNAYSILTENEEIGTEGEIIKIEILKQLFAGFDGIYYM